MSEVLPYAGWPQTEVRKVFSHQVGMEYQLTVRLPGNYASSGQHYPVIYVLDGDVFFGMAAALFPLVRFGDVVPEMIIVGIGYNRGMSEWGSLREKDFKIPEVQPDTPDSHADRFLAALKQELIPFIDANYRTDPCERTLYGYSSGGFFTIYTLVNEPDLFRHYLAGSPDTDLSCPYLLAHDDKLAAHDGHRPVDLFLSVGDLEDGAAQSSLVKFNELAAAIRANNYPGLRLMTRIYVGENHGMGGLALTYINGLFQCCSTARP